MPNFKMDIVFTLILFSLVNIHLSESKQGKTYSMYVWNDGYDASVAGCEKLDVFQRYKLKSKCFTSTWDNEDKRKWLWNTCNLEGRKVSTIFFSDVYHTLKDQNCNRKDVSRLRTMLKEGHTQVPGLKIYGVYSANDKKVSEQTQVPYIVYYNDNCAKSDNEKFDGVAVNNEAYAGIKCLDDQYRTEYLDNLMNIASAAGLQKKGKLLTHFSVGWHWGICNEKLDKINYHGHSATANEHMIDIFDSVDVQVATRKVSDVNYRLTKAGYEYAIVAKKDMHVNIYLNRVTPAAKWWTSLFPDAEEMKDTGSVPTEKDMFNLFDALSQHEILKDARPNIHCFRGVYSSGGPGWPAHK